MKSQRSNDRAATGSQAGVPALAGPQRQVVEFDRGVPLRVMGLIGAIANLDTTGR